MAQPSLPLSVGASLALWLVTEASLVTKASRPTPLTKLKKRVEINKLNKAITIFRMVRGGYLVEWFMALVLKTSTSKKSRRFESDSARKN